MVDKTLMLLGILLFLLTPFAQANDQPPRGFSSLYTYFAESAVMRAHNDWLDANAQRARGEFSCIRAPTKTVFFCRTKKNDNNFFCAATSGFDREKMRAVANGHTDKFEGLADQNLRISCEGIGWFCEQAGGGANDCFTRAAYDRANPLLEIDPGPLDLECHRRVPEFIRENYPGRGTSEKLRYLASADSRPAVQFVRNVCEFLKSEGEGL